ncbi:hypothetical protein TSAR_006348 [Trichomalopsis sarcophagae]|uniref:Uncharacterized protein n=1 Tax=Trichomalopsis sarcophagae TaxID=543379 RepID=A0A232FKQ0_9HYME|nr:hypothetical protein TSAR_006348 [Trichomalopsis sarcophagae]
MPIAAFFYWDHCEDQCSLSLALGLAKMLNERGKQLRPKKLYACDDALEQSRWDSHNRKNGGDQSCRISKGQPDGDLGFDLERVFQGHLKVNFGFLNRNPILLLRE